MKTQEEQIKFLQRLMRFLKGHRVRGVSEQTSYVEQQYESISSRSNVVEGNVDRLVQDEFFQDPAYKGVMVEVGAARPDFLSIGASFRTIGWRVIAVEPNPQFAAMHRGLGHEIVQVACGEEDADEASFFVVSSKKAIYLGGEVTGESFSSLGIRGDFADLMATVDVDTTEIKVPVRRLDRVLRELVPPVSKVDVLSVDVEGWELEVLRGIDLDHFNPKVLIIEHLTTGPDYEDVIRTMGYNLWRRIPPNELYVRSNDLPDVNV